MPRLIDKCIICGAECFTADRRATRYLDLPEPFKVCRCNSCEFLFLNPQPTQSEYEEIYSAAYFESQAAGSMSDFAMQFPAPPEEYSGVADSRKRWYESRLASIEKRSPRLKSVLDVGAGTGEFLLVAAQRGWEAEGIELSEYACQKALQEHGLNIKCCDLTQYDPGGRTFDVLHLSHLFEHLVEPRQALRKLRSMMHEQSLLVIEVPQQFSNWVDRVVDVKNRRRQLGRSLHSIHHPYFYSARHLSRLVENEGFTVHKLRTFFPERWVGGGGRKVLAAVDWLADKLGRRGRNVELIAGLTP